MNGKRAKKGRRLGSYSPHPAQSYHRFAVSRVSTTLRFPYWSRPTAQIKKGHSYDGLLYPPFLSPSIIFFGVACWLTTISLSPCRLVGQIRSPTAAPHGISKHIHIQQPVPRQPRTSAMLASRRTSMTEGNKYQGTGTSILTKPVMQDKKNSTPHCICSACECVRCVCGVCARVDLRAYCDYFCMMTLFMVVPRDHRHHELSHHSSTRRFPTAILLSACVRSPGSPSVHVADVLCLCHTIFSSFLNSVLIAFSTQWFPQYPYPCPSCLYPPRHSIPCDLRLDRCHETRVCFCTCSAACQICSASHLQLSSHYASETDREGRRISEDEKKKRKGKKPE